LVGGGFSALSNVRKTTLQLTRQIGFWRGDMDRLARLSTQPFIQFLRSGGYKAAFAFDGHARTYPTLRDGNRLPQEGGDLLPAFERFRLLPDVASTPTDVPLREDSSSAPANPEKDK